MSSKLLSLVIAVMLILSLSAVTGSPAVAARRTARHSNLKLPRQ